MNSNSRTKIQTLLLILALVLNPYLVLAQDINLPDMGSPADAVLSKTDEAQIGRSIMQQIRASGTIIDDPQIN